MLWNEANSSSQQIFWNLLERYCTAYFLPVGGTAGNAAHQSCGTRSKSTPGCYRRNVPGLLWLLCWSHSLTQLVTMHRDVCLVPNLHSCSDELGLQKTGCYWLLRQSLGWWSGSEVQEGSCILKNRKYVSPLSLHVHVSLFVCLFHYLFFLPLFFLPSSLFSLFSISIPDLQYMYICTFIPLLVHSFLLIFHIIPSFLFSNFLY